MMIEIYAGDKFFIPLFIFYAILYNHNNNCIEERVITTSV